MDFDAIIVGGGAAGFFAANQILSHKPTSRVLILEKASRPLDKVRISGGGRCNVTHACFDPKELVTYYPRGGKELMGPFHRFQPGDTIAWFDELGVELKTEEDGRMFPITDQSETIMEALKQPFFEAGGKLNLAEGATNLKPIDSGWEVTTTERVASCSTVLVSPGSSRPIWDILNGLGHSMVHPVPSLFTFKTKDARVKDLPGVVAKDVVVKIEGSSFEESGPLLITHWGLSGPAILKLSSIAARHLADGQYKFYVTVNWVGKHQQEVSEELKVLRSKQPKMSLANHNPTELPQRLWLSLLAYCGVTGNQKWAEVGNVALQKLSESLCASRISIDGKSTNKDEFVTAGGVALKEVNFKTMESKLLPNLYFAGEVLDIDALTGGFNFQAAWTTGYLAGQAMAEKL